VISFASDNYAPAHPKVLEKLQQVNTGHVPAYGADQYTKTAIELIQNSLGAPQAEVFFVFNGTGANVVSISNVVNSWNSIICAETAHINVDEGGAPEKIMGTKLVDLKTEDGKLTPELIAPIFVRMGDQHTSQPNLISITQTTEMGTVYTTDEIKALADFAHQHEAFLHVDGARISNAAVSLNKKFDEIITETNVDFLSFGGTKNGLLGAEAVVILNSNLAKNTPWIRKSSMQLASKHRYLAAQFLAFFEEDLWKQNASHANQMASKLRSSIEHNPKITLTQKTQANAVFAILDPQDIEKLQREFHFYVWNSNTNEVRWMCSWDTEPAAVESFASAINSL
jgi:threonine aldolase